MGEDQTRIHASCVTLGDRAALLIGPSGAGKSALALELMSLGASLVSDDQTLLRREGERLIASSPAPIAGMIEARGIGIFRVREDRGVEQATVHLAVDLAHKETARLPEWRRWSCLDLTIPCFRAISGPHFAATILLYLQRSIDRDA